MIITKTIKGKNVRGRWNFAVNAALRAPVGTAIVIEGLNRKDRHSAAESIRHRKLNLFVIEYGGNGFGLLIVYKPSMEFWHNWDENNS